MDALAHAVDHFVKPGRDVGVLHDSAGEGVGCGVEQAPGVPVFLEVVEGGLVVLAGYVGDPLHADDPLAPHLHDGVIGLLVGQHRVPVALESAVLPVALVGQGLDDLPDDAGEVALQVRGVLALDDRISEEREVIANEDARAKADAHGETAVVAVTEPYGVLVAAVGRAQRQQAEIASSVLGDAVVLADDLVAVHAERGPHQIHDAEMRDRDVGSGRRRRVELAKVVIVNAFRVDMKQERHALSPKEQDCSLGFYHKHERALGMVILPWYLE